MASKEVQVSQDIAPLKIESETSANRVQNTSNDQETGFFERQQSLIAGTPKMIEVADANVRQNRP
jgi:hypothetical protein